MWIYTHTHARTAFEPQTLPPLYSLVYNRAMFLKYQNDNQTFRCLKIHHSNVTIPMIKFFEKLADCFSFSNLYVFISDIYTHTQLLTHKYSHRCIRCCILRWCITERCFWCRLGAVSSSVTPWMICRQMPKSPLSSSYSTSKLPYSSFWEGLSSLTFYLFIYLLVFDVLFSWMEIIVQWTILSVFVQMIYQLDEYDKSFC